MSPVELFFDLVFVFAITQLTGIVVHPHGAGDYLRAAIVFGTLMWMYAGYTWLTSNVTVDRPWPRQLLIVAMAGFFAMALGIPDVFGEGGLPFAVGFLIVTAIHAFLFATATLASPAAVRGMAGFNFGAVGLVFAAAFVDPPWDWPLWTVALVVVYVLSALRVGERAFDVSPEHFSERNGLLIIVALGESVVAVGTGVNGLPLDAPRLAVAVLSLLLAASIWSTYFDGDDRRAERSLATASQSDRARMALYGYGYAHLAMIAGIVLVAAGLETAITRPSGVPETAGIWNLAAGLTLYLVGDSAYRWLLDIGRNRLRIMTAVTALLTVPVGLEFGSLAQVVACVVPLYALTFAERSFEVSRRPRSR